MSDSLISIFQNYLIVTTKSLRIDVICPKCGLPGIIKLKVIGRKYKYIIVDHGDKECGIGSLKDQKVKDWVIQEINRFYQELLKLVMSE